MKIAIDKIKVDGNKRIRKEVGDLQALEDSIKKVGLLNPLVIDETGELIAGYRRLSACKNLGITEVEVNVIELAGDRIGKLEVELAENFQRKDFTPEEILASETRRKEILESMREKTIWERCKHWMKNLLFPPPSDPSGGQRAEKNQDPNIKPEEKETEEAPNPETKDTDANSRKPEYREKPITDESSNSPSLVNKVESAADDQHTIKWRTS